MSVIAKQRKGKYGYIVSFVENNHIVRERLIETLIYIETNLFRYVLSLKYLKSSEQA